MSAHGRGPTGSILVDPRDATKTSATFFDEMPWDGSDLADTRQWSSSRFFELFLDANSAVNE